MFVVSNFAFGLALIQLWFILVSFDLIREEEEDKFYDVRCDLKIVYSVVFMFDEQEQL